MLDRFLRNLVHGEISVGKTKIAFLDGLLAAGTTVAGIMIRKAVFGIAGTGGGAEELLYCVLDFVLALCLAYFVWKTTKSSLRTAGVYALAVIWPAIAANSALNGGAEVTGAVVLAGMLCVLAAKKIWNRGAFFLFSLLVCNAQLLFREEPLERLTYFWPNIYTLFSETGYFNEYGVTGKFLTLGILLIIFYYISKKKFQATPELFVSAGLFFSLLISVFYPFMNYRSGFLANVFAILLFIQNKKKCYVPMAMCMISYVSYGYFYNGKTGVFFWIYALALVVLMLDAGVSLYRQLHTGKTV